ncbi:MAG: LytTR family DNA-binding domain-containing protein [Vicinamibacteria bacterium]|nr:LytTR family DNA-binding domain-containing protein [Vicinamibacteria bacterium]
MTLRALIADDEQLARERICDLLAREDDVEIVGEARNGEEAVAKILELRPSVVFLDIQMPALDGFGVIERIDTDHLPLIVFTTAYDQYALKAFEVHALDYLLKPFDPDRFHEAVGRIRARLESAQEGESGDLTGLVDLIRGRSRHLERIALRSASRFSFVRVEEVDCFEACGNYVRVCLANEEHLLRSTLSGLETRLDPARFVRIHRSTIVNVERIQELQSSFHGEYVVTLVNGRRLALSRGFRSRLQALIDNRI